MKKSMNENFKLLYDRVVDTNNVSDIKKINSSLSSIKESVICVGSGGSSVVSEFASKVFAAKNNCIAITKDPRDLLYDENISSFKELFICSYSSNNHGVKVALKLPLIKKLFTCNEAQIPDGEVITYKTSLEKEKSFISLGATLMPISILLNYYLDGINFNNILKEIFAAKHQFELKETTGFEIMSGFDTSVPAKYLMSTLTEAGLGMAVEHNKYDYCHGRTTLAHHHKGHTLIYLKSSDTKLDKLLLQETSSLYEQIIVLESNYNDTILDNFNLLVQSMYLTKAIAKHQGKDLSRVNYAPVVKKLYYFKGEM